MTTTTNPRFPMTTTTTTRFPKTISALKGRNKNEWEIADALVAELPPSKGRGYHVNNQWERLADELVAEGIEFKASTLRNYRDVAARWEAPDRLDDVSFTAHKAALPSATPRKTLVTLRDAKRASGSSVTVQDVKDAVGRTSKTNTAADYGKILSALEKGVEGTDVAFAKWMAADSSRMKRLEALVTDMPKAWDVLTQAVPTTKPTAVKASDPKTSAKRKGGSTAAKSKSTKGRMRG